MAYRILFGLLSASIFISNASILAIDDYEHPAKPPLSIPAENESDTHNTQLAELKKAMQEDPQFEEDFMHRVRIGGKAALYNAARWSTVGTAVGVATGVFSTAIGTALGKALIYGINKFRAPHNRIIPVSNSIRARTIAQTIGVSAACTAAVWGGVGVYLGAANGCSACGREDKIFLSECDETIQHDQTETLKANQEAGRWVRNHVVLTMLTLISDKPAYNALHTELGLRIDDSNTE